MAEGNPLRSLLSGQQLDRIPFWFCDHLGLWHRGFREWRAEVEWASMYADASRAASLSHETAGIWSLDAVTLWSNPLAPLQLLGHEPVIDGQGVVCVDNIVHSPAQIQKMRVMERPVEQLAGYEVLRATAEINTDRVVVARLWGPLTLLGHLIEGKAKWQPRLRALLFQYPGQARLLLQHITKAMVRWSKAMAEAGVEVFFVDERWAPLIGPEDLSVFSLPWLLDYVEKMRPVPVTVRTRGMDAMVGKYHKADVAGYMPDMHSPVEPLRQASAWSLPLLGPFDSGRLLSPPPVIAQSVGRFVETYGKDELVMSLASPPLPHTSSEQIAALVQAVAEFRS